MIVIWNGGAPVPVAHIAGFDYKRRITQIKREALKKIDNYRMKQLRKRRKPKRLRKEE